MRALDILILVPLSYLRTAYLPVYLRYLTLPGDFCFCFFFLD